MSIQNYGKVEKGRYKKLKKRITALITAAIILIIGISIVGVLAGDSEDYMYRSEILRENHELKEKVRQLEEKVSELEGTVSEKDSYIASLPTEAPTEEAPADEEASAGEWEIESPRDTE